MSAASLRATVRPLIPGVLIFGLALAVRYQPVEQAVNLPVRPDSLDYTASAMALAREGKYAVTVAGEDYPPRYFPGYPLLLSPATWLWGFSGVVYTNWVLGALGAPLVWLWGRRRHGDAAALAAGILLALSPVSVIKSREIMADAPAASLVPLLGLLLMSAGRLRWLALAGTGVLLGLGMAVKVSFAFLALPCFLGPLLDRGRGWRATARDLAWLGAGLALSLAPLLAHSWHTFGSPLANGYSFWEPEIHAPGFVHFHPRYLWTDYRGEEGNLARFAPYLFGFKKPYLSPLLWPLVLLGGAAVLRDRVARRLGDTALLLGSFPLFLAIFGCFYGFGARFVLPGLAPVCLLAGVGLMDARRRLGRAGRAGVLAVAVAAVLVSPSVLGRVRVSYEPWTPQPIDFYNGLGLLQSSQAQGALVVSNEPALLLGMFLAPGQQHLALGGEQDMHLEQATHFRLPSLERMGEGRVDEPEQLVLHDELRPVALRRLRAALASGRPVFLLYCDPPPRELAVLRQAVRLTEERRRGAWEMFRLQAR